MISCQILVMLRDKVKQQEDTIRSLQEYKEKYDIAEKGMSDAQHTSVITTQQAEVSFAIIPVSQPCLTRVAID